MSNTLINVPDHITNIGTRQFAEFQTDEFSLAVETDPIALKQYTGIYDPERTDDWETSWEYHYSRWYDDTYSELEYEALLAAVTNIAALLNYSSAGNGPKLDIDLFFPYKLGFTINNPETSWTTQTILAIFAHLRFPTYIEFTKTHCWITLLITPHPTDPDRAYIRTEIPSEL